MPRRRIIRTEEEEAEIQITKKRKQAEYQRKYRERQKNRNNTGPDNGHDASYSYFQADDTNSALDSGIIPNDDSEDNNENDFQSIQIPIVIDRASKMKNRRALGKGFLNLNISPDKQSSDIIEHIIGSMNVECEHCKAKHFSAEKVANKKSSFRDCCDHGKVMIDPLPKLPYLLQQLYQGYHPKSYHFLERIRGYNNAFSFASFNANLVNLSTQRNGPYCFKIQGQIYYQINNALYPGANENPSYGQLFIIDEKEAAENRLNQNSNLDEELLISLGNELHRINVFAQSYIMMHEEIQNETTQMGSHSTPSNLQLTFLPKSGIDKGRYNAQRTNEVAAIFSTTADGEIPNTYVTVKNRMEKTLQNVNSMDPNVEPWIYPLFYPYGTQGWHANLKLKDSNKRLTRCMYVLHQMAIRDEFFNTFLSGGRLFQQWVVDNYVKIEKDRINYLKFNQKQLRAESYQGLTDYLQKQSENIGGHIGRVIILPSSFVGSPRNMMQHYQDSMAIVRKFGKPDLFITMTCNPIWADIVNNLLPNQKAADRPDICARVFNIKKDYLIDLIVRQKLFGEVMAYVYTIEFQKRGLPHIHLLVTFKQSCKITGPHIVNQFVSAEIPDPNINRNLHDIVIRHMIHGPCADWCKVNGKCSKRFPKQFQPETTMDENGYPQYRRKDTGIMYEKNEGFEVDNRNVVPYSPTLSTVFNCHINVEVVSSISAVKYIYQYIYKGNDAASVVIENDASERRIDHDEIRNYIEARYVGPVEACWRIFSKPLQEKSHAITRLPVHLPNQQNVVINNDLSDEEIRSALQKTTMLLDYLQLKNRDNDAKQYFYSDIPRHYVFKKVTLSNGEKVNQWEKRKSFHNVIGRMYSVSPTQSELFNLRILLLNVRGASSYEELRTVNGEICQTFTAACLARGLIEDDAEWNRALNEAKSWMMPRQLRSLFVRILIHCQPVHPRDLWEEFKIPLSEDYIRRFGQSTGIMKAYSQINNMLEKEDWDLSKFPEMEQVTMDFEEQEQEQLLQEISIGQTQYDKLNVKQKEIVDTILRVAEGANTSRRCFYIDGPGGSGKTFVYSTLFYLLKSRKKNVCTMAFTGIAATLLPNGKTVHKTLGLPVPLFTDSTSNISAQSKEGIRLKEVDVFIWDEAPMAPRYALEVMDRTLRDFMNNDLPFGGKIVILGGDFRQLLPVKERATRTETINLSIKFSHLWKLFTTHRLTENMRALPEEKEFSQFLLDMGNGTLNDESENILIPDKCIANINSDIATATYGDIIKNKQYRIASKHAILSARNIDVDDINCKVINLLDEKTEKMYTSIDSTETTGDEEDINHEAILTEYLNTLNPPSLPPHELRLRKYSVIMLIRNLSISEGLCNGTRLMVLELTLNVLRCEILTGSKAGEIVFLNRITLHCDNIYPFSFKRRQFPVKVAFAMTINKSQGQTFDRIGIDLRKDIFNHGQLYVAFSRVRSWESLRVYLRNENLQIEKKIKNYVFQEIFT